MTVKDLMDILKNKQEIPRPEDAELCFYFTNEDGETIDLKLKSVGAFSFSTDITIGFEKDS
jgi:hypothetical protein